MSMGQVLGILEKTALLEDTDIGWGEADYFLEAGAGTGGVASEIVVSKDVDIRGGVELFL